MTYTQESLFLQNIFKRFNDFNVKKMNKTNEKILRSFLIKIHQAFNTKYKPIKQIVYSNSYYTKINSSLFNAIPLKIKGDIQNNYSNYYNISYIIGDKTINYNICNKMPLNAATLDDMIQKMNMWLTIAFEAANNHCSDTLDVYLFLTDHKKEIPVVKMPINTDNANTAFTTSCSSHNEIFIYRYQEWFKVFIHETFHSLGLDFSHTDVSIADSKINKIFSTKIKDLRLYESYCETWGETMNLLFISFFNTISKGNYDLMIKRFHTLHTKETMFSVYQMISVLRLQNINYKDMLQSDRIISYKENTNAFSYYVLKTILLFHLNDYLTWCSKNNSNAINFSIDKLDNYVDLVYKLHNSKSFLKQIENVDMQSQNKKIPNTLRMTMFELL